MAIYDNIVQTIGNTPLVKLAHFSTNQITIYAKVEAFNPGGSIKDRMAKAIIEDAELKGELSPGQTVIEATSGNTGIGLALVCAQKGYPLVVVMAENFSIERRKLLRFLGAKVVLTPAAEKGTGMLNKAEELAQAHGYFLCRQFDNEVNARVHQQTTAQEIIADFEGKRLDYWVSGFGTGGTLKGVSAALKAHDPDIQIVVAEPDNSPILSSGIAQPRDKSNRPNASHPHFRPHLMQGWSPDFISSLAEGARESGLIDRIVPVAGKQALQIARDLARYEGIFAGITSGATLAGAIKVAQRAKPGSNIVCMLPDTGERYLSTPLFEDIGVCMDQDEIALSRSTPGYQFAQPAPASAEKKPPGPALNTVDPEIKQLTDAVIEDNPVVMFALEWCEFCWSARKLFKAMGIACHSVDLDSVAYQQNNLGGNIRAALLARCHCPTIPQIFIAGHHMGGSSDLFSAYKDGALMQLLDKMGVPYSYDPALNIDKLLPGWIQPTQHLTQPEEI